MANPSDPNDVANQREQERLAEMRRQQDAERTAELRRHTAELKRQAAIQKEIAKQQADARKKQRQDIDKANAAHRRQMQQQARDQQRMQKMQRAELKQQQRDHQQLVKQQRRDAEQQIRMSKKQAQQAQRDARTAQREAQRARQQAQQAETSGARGEKPGIRNNLPSRQEIYRGTAGGVRGALTGGIEGARKGGFGDLANTLISALWKGPLPAKALAAAIKALTLAERVVEYSAKTGMDATTSGSEIYLRTRAKELGGESIEENMRLNRGVAEANAAMRLTLDRSAVNWTKTVTDGMQQMFDTLSIETGFDQTRVTSELIDAVGDIHVQTGMSLAEVGATIKRLSQVTGKDQVAAIQDLSGVVRMTGHYSDVLYKRGVRGQAMTAEDMMEAVVGLTDSVENFSGDASDYAEQVGRLSTNMRALGASYEHSRKMTEQMVKGLSAQGMSNEYAASVQSSTEVKAAVASRIQELENKAAAGKATTSELAQLEQGRLMQEAQAAGAPMYVTAEMFRSFAASSTKVQAAAFEDVMRRSGATKVGESVGYISEVLGISQEAVLRLQKEWVKSNRSAAATVGGFGGQGGLPTDRRTQIAAGKVKYAGADLEQMLDSSVTTALAQRSSLAVVKGAMEGKEFLQTEVYDPLIKVAGGTAEDGSKSSLFDRNEQASAERAKREQAGAQAPSTITPAGSLTGQVTNVSPNGSITIVVPNMGAALSGMTASQIRAQAGNK